MYHFILLCTNKFDLKQVHSCLSVHNKTLRCTLKHGEKHPVDVWTVNAWNESQSNDGMLTHHVSTVYPMLAGKYTLENSTSKPKDLKLTETATCHGSPSRSYNFNFNKLIRKQVHYYLKEISICHP